MSTPYRFTRRALRAMDRIVAQSMKEWGRDASIRYETLIFAAIDDIAENPTRVASRVRPEFGWGMRSWHLRLSRERARTPTGIVNDPRHLVFYRVESGVVVIEHVLHEKQDVRRHFAK